MSNSYRILISSAIPTFAKVLLREGKGGEGTGRGEERREGRGREGAEGERRGGEGGQGREGGPPYCLM